MRKKELGKRGFFLAEETMKILLAIICIGFLIFILVKMYYSYDVSKESEQAKGTLLRIEKEIALIGDEGKKEIVVYSPKGWTLMGFSEEKIPLLCSNKKWNSCLCICKESSNVWHDACDEPFENNVGSCVSLDGKKFSAEKVEFSNVPVTIVFTEKERTISFSEK